MPPAKALVQPSGAAEERDAAARAPTPAIARTHNDLALMYDRQARAAAREPALAD
jgi:hypothetical protein